MTNLISVYVGTTVIYWSAIVICLGVCAWFCLSSALYTAAGGRVTAMWVCLPLGCVLSLAFSRFLHWYCHVEQYTGLAGAFSDLGLGSYCMPGVLLGVILAAVIVWVFRLAPSLPPLLDALAPGAALGIAIIRLSAPFNSSCRGTIIITDPRYQRLPLGSGVSAGSGGVEYHFATFFVYFLLLMALTVLLLVFYFRSRRRRLKSGPRHGHTAILFLLLYSAMDLVLDSTRYDSSFFRSNGFVSVAQIISALCILAILAYYSAHSIRANGLRLYHWIIWAVYLATVGGTGYLEYLVQRHGNWYLACYSGMSVCCAAMALTVCCMYRTLLAPPPTRHLKKAE